MLKFKVSQLILESIIWLFKILVWKNVQIYDYYLYISHIILNGWFWKLVRSKNKIKIKYFFNLLVNLSPNTFFKYKFVLFFIPLFLIFDKVIIILNNKNENIRHHKFLLLAALSWYMLGNIKKNCNWAKVI